MKGGLMCEWSLLHYSPLNKKQYEDEARTPETDRWIDVCKTGSSDSVHYASSIIGKIVHMIARAKFKIGSEQRRAHISTHAAPSIRAHSA
ncbi:hypothetical protein VTO73DRAFT_8995 [Trametes versicolor]